MDGAATGIVGGGSVADLGSLERWWNDPGIAAWTFVLFGCFLLNVTLLLAFLVRPGLRTISNRFVMNLTASNLLMCAVLNPLLIMDSPSTGTTLTSMSDTSFGSTSTSTSVGNICAISEGATALVTTSSVLSVLLIAIDQYYAVVDPLRYRARVDKLKSGVLIVSVWLVSSAFGLIAALNPSPRSLWLSCTPFDNSSFRDVVLNASVDALIDPAFPLFGNESEQSVAAAAPALLKTIESVKIDGSVGLLENSTVIFRTLTNDTVTYGLIYTVVHSVFAYLLPFAGVCWIYISIYSAAHRNSERTRRTGSRPILASASFCEDQYGYARPQHQQPVDAYLEEFRRIPKISSLSSIDETSETTHSANQASRRRSFSSSSDAAQTTSINENAASGVIFTVGLQPVEVSPSRGQDGEDSRAGKTPVAVLNAEDLHDDCGVSSYEELVGSQYRDRRRKSSHDLMYEVVSAGESSAWIPGESSGSESDDERRHGYFDSLEVPRSVHRIADRRSSDYLLTLAGCETTERVYGDTENCERDYSGGTTRRSDDDEEEEEEEDSAVVKTSECSAAERERMQNANCGDLESGRSKRVGERASKFGNVDGNGESRSNGKNADNSKNNANAEPSACLLTPIVTITPAPSKPGTLNRVSSVRSTSSYINSLKHRISNGSLFRYREETRAARISALVIVMGLICWSPYVLLSVMKNLPQYSDYEFPHEYDVLALSFFILAAYVSPLLFGYRSRRVKRELRKFFCFRRELSYKNNRSLMAKKVLKRRHSSTLSHLEMDHRYNIFNCVYGRSKWPKEKVQFVQVPDTALAVETCRSSFSSGASTQISSTSTEEC